MFFDRRRAEQERRAVARVPAVFAVKSVFRGRLQLGQAEDVGAGGLAVRRPKDLPLTPGTGLVLTFALPGQATLLRVSASVVTDRLTGTFRRTGVKFVALGAAERQLITEFCFSRLAPAYPTAIVA
jgi:c-di-GMP-binding flagellar brake protein YcgR